VGGTTLNSIVDAGVRDTGKTVALAAAWRGFQMSYVPPGDRAGWNKSAELVLREAGLIRRSSVGHCGITHSFSKLDRRIPALDWSGLFTARYGQAERQAIEAVAASGVNITNFVNLLDVFNDLLLEAVFLADGTIGRYTLGKVGSALNAHSRFATKFPAAFALANEVHDRRYESMASHPLVKRSGKPTMKISYQFLPRAKRLLIAAASELRSAGLA